MPESYTKIKRTGSKLSRPQQIGRLLAAADLPLVALTTPLLLFPNRWTPLALPLLLLPWLGRWLAHGRLTRPSQLNVPVLLIVVMGIIGYLVSPAAEMSWAKLWGIVLQAVLFFAMLNNLHTQSHLLRAAEGLLIGTLLVTLFSVVGTDWSLTRLVELPAVYDRLPQLIDFVPGSGVPRQTAIIHPRQAGATMAMLLPFALAFLLFSANRRRRILAAAVSVPALVVLLLSQAVMGLFGLALALSLLLVWWRRRLFLVVGLAPVAVIAAIVIYGPERLARLALDIEHPLGIGMVLRLDMWSRALAMIGDAPLTGIGLNNYSLVQSHFYPGYLIGPEVHAHNMWLQTAVDLGLPGLLAFLSLLVALYLTLYRAHKHTDNREVQVLLIGLAAAVLAYVGGGLLDVMTLGAKPVAALWAMLGLAAAATRLVGADSRLHPLWPGSPWLALAPALLFILSLLVAAPGRWYRNVGVVQAHRALVTARESGTLPTTEARTAINNLNEALRREPPSTTIYSLLGSLQAWAGQHNLAQIALEQRVLLDGPQALARYAPFTAWQRILDGQPAPPPWSSTGHLYSQWLTRFPERAEAYVLVALAQERQGRPDAALRTIEKGIAAGARPDALLRAWAQAKS